MVGARGISGFEALLRFDLLNIPKLRIPSPVCIQKGLGLGMGGIQHELLYSSVTHFSPYIRIFLV